MVTNHPTNECSLPDCFCHEAQQFPVTKTTFGCHLDTCNVCASVAQQFPDLELFDHQLCPEGRQLFRNLQSVTEQPTPDSPALRRGRSILHHVEMVEEQLYTESMRTRGVPHKPHEFIPQEHAREFCAYQPSPEAPRCYLSQMNVLAHTPPQEQKPAQSTFDDVWNSAPESMRRVTEMEAAEFFYHAGRRDRETEMLREVNEVLSGVVRRIERERVR